MSINFSSLTVTYNDEVHLKECLDSLKFCKEGIVVDLGSHDGSVQIAKDIGAQVYHWERKEIVEAIKSEAIRLPKNDWIIFLDPDEVFPEQKIERIRQIITRENDLGAVSVMIQNFFLSRLVKYGRWRPYFHNGRIIYRPAVLFTESVHSGMKFNPGFRTIALPDAVIKHYWVDSIPQFYEKHERYLIYEGQSRFQNNISYSAGKMAKALIVKFFTFFFIRKGILDYKNVWQLIRLAMWYEYQSWLSLKKYQFKQKIK